MIVNTALEHVPIKLENFNDDHEDHGYPNSKDCSSVWRTAASSSSKFTQDEEAAESSLVLASASCSDSSSAAIVIDNRTKTAENLELLEDVIESCGSVFIYSRRKLFLICGFCDSKYANMLQFAKHLNDCHKIFYENCVEMQNQNQFVHQTHPTDDSDSDAATTASSSLSASSGLIVKGGFQIRFLGESATAENEEESLPTPTDVLLRHVPIKVEDEQVLEDDENAMHDFENNIESCGNIFIMNRKKLFLICGFCEGRYGNMELFAAHLHECHKVFEEDDDGNQQSMMVAPQPLQEIKEEPQEVLVAVKRNSNTRESLLPMVAIPTVGNEDIIPTATVHMEEGVSSSIKPKRKRALLGPRSERDSSKDTDDLSGESFFSEQIPSREEEYFQRGTKGTNHCCRQCPKQFKKLSRMMDHVRIHTGEKPYKCLQCGKCFRIKLRLSEHLMRHRDIKAFKCEICGLPCATRQDYTLHKRHHTGDKRYSCKECGKAFVRSSDLKTHLRIHSDERPFKCEICNTTFRANQNLIMHRRMHEPDKPFKCDFCDKRFRRKIDRKVHHRTHTGEKAYKCEICNRGYSAKVHVRQHIEKRHMKAMQQPQDENNCQTKVEKPLKMNKMFKCSICTKAYSAKYTLLQHIKKVHNLEAVPTPTTIPQVTTPIKDDTSQQSTNITNLSPPEIAANPPLSESQTL
ncbi:zinc finger protein 701-like [Eupeodes corollae]|uniref:zinc finger protein 701-like n=1 Tax=Eupeodes corollae TaxID=290404 RepID=UPI0024902B14|nr:zinc finger protein 701-like [Eupeodes corollae]